VDPQWACSTRWILDNNVDEASLDLVFALSTIEFGQEKQHELVWAGATKAVTEVSYERGTVEREKVVFEQAS